MQQFASGTCKQQEARWKEVIRIWHGDNSVAVSGCGNEASGKIQAVRRRASNKWKVASGRAHGHKRVLQGHKQHGSRRQECMCVSQSAASGKETDRQQMARNKRQAVAVKRHAAKRQAVAARRHGGKASWWQGG